MRYVTLSLIVLAFCGAMLAGTTQTMAAQPSTPAVKAAPVAALSAADVGNLEARETQAAPLAEFRGGDAETLTAIAAWSGLGFGLAAFILVFCI